MKTFNLKKILNILVVLCFGLFLGSAPFAEPNPSSSLEAGSELRRENKTLKELYYDVKCELEEYQEKLNSIEPMFDKNTEHYKKYQYMKQKLYCAEANLALAAIECGHFQSSFYKRSNNMFSMGLSKRPYDFEVGNSGDSNYKAGFNTWQQSIDDMYLWQKSKVEAGLLDTTSNEAYIKSLKRVGYAEDPHHEDAVLKTYSRLFLDWNQIQSL